MLGETPLSPRKREREERIRSLVRTPRPHERPEPRETHSPLPHPATRGEGWGEGDYRSPLRYGFISACGYVARRATSTSARIDST